MPLRAHCSSFPRVVTLLCWDYATMAARWQVGALLRRYTPPLTAIASAAGRSLTASLRRVPARRRHTRPRALAHARARPGGGSGMDGLLFDQECRLSAHGAVL